MNKTMNPPLITTLPLPSYHCLMILLLTWLQTFSLCKWEIEDDRALHIIFQSLCNNPTNPTVKKRREVYVDVHVDYVDAVFRMKYNNIIVIIHIIIVIIFLVTSYTSWLLIWSSKVLFSFSVDCHCINYNNILGIHY